MELILKDSFSFGFNISDFAIDRTNLKIIMTGDSLNFVKDNKIIKSIKGKMKKSQNLRFIKYDNQLFQSNDFYAISNQKIYKINSSKYKIEKEIDLNINNSFVDNIQVSSRGNVVYILNNVMYVYNLIDENLKTYPLKFLGEGIYKLYISEENVIIKHRKMGTSDVEILIFNLNTLKIISKFSSSVNHVYSKIVELNYLGSTNTGEIEVWDILESQIKKSYKISDYQITYIDNDYDYFYFGTSIGELIITDKNFNIIKKQIVFNFEISKIIIFNSKIYVMSHNSKFKIFEILDENKMENIIDEFLEKYEINNSYKEFFTSSRVIAIKDFLSNLKHDNIDYTPKENDIFKALRDDLNNIKVCLIGKDPYFQKGVATGLAFEVKSNSWFDEKVNTSLKNMLKLIYKTYTGKYEDINEIREAIKKEDFKILAPIDLFESWRKQGVLLLNSSLTTEIDKAGAHHKFWQDITKTLIEYISTKNKDITYLLWGNDAAVLEKNILSGKIIKHNHPAICGNLNNLNDFMLGKSFEDTKSIINWKGI
ncbi:uracil-DNA glycosylase family protein [Pseudostreptobacillus hongkongensis]|uniref:uracil-DNA glycosylase family protein n=1 Tax=Pseudostreptobacillus hongkongensis TaxID=1162717 RepID=UPI000831CB4F|nr:uracil-DNA glycosylase family protein [Pseudostreptobacillus hongkongensis]